MMQPEQHQRVVGQTKDAGFQIGARRTFAVAPQHAWDALMSNKGVQLWLGDTADLRWKHGARYQTSDGATGEVRVVSPGSHVRLTWQPPDWPRASTIQVRVIPDRDKTTISFHQEHLPDAQTREQMRQHWQSALAAIEPLLDE
jgi:uncharacterized protein YndB with AHSA1/START domain